MRAQCAHSARALLAVTVAVFATGRGLAPPDRKKIPSPRAPRLVGTAGPAFGTCRAAATPVRAMPRSASVEVVNSSGDGTALREAAIAVTRSPIELHCGEDADAGECWRALVLGGFTVVDHFERDGLRILIAKRTHGDALGAAKLTARTREVLARRAQGHALKVIAAELGISIATASREVARGSAALAVATTAELACLVR